jgi:xanthine permease XanP
MVRKPSNITYGVDDRPPVPATLILALQHLFFLGVGLMFPVIVLRAINAPPGQIEAVVSLSMIAAGLGTIVQTLKRGPVGSGYLCAEGNDPTIISFSILAGKIGGLPLILGMTVISGAMECLLGRLLHRLRTIFPTEVTGLILMMVGMNLLPYGIANFFGTAGVGGVIHGPTAAVGAVTLAVTCGINVWSRGRLRLYAILLGIAAGFAAAWLFGLLSATALHRLAAAPVFAFPDISVIRFSFNVALLVPLFIVTLSSTLKSVAAITMCQKVNDADWKRPDMSNISKGIAADGIASILGGVLGGMRQSLYAATVGLSVATGVTSRIVGQVMGVAFVLLAFFPKLATVYSIMPAPVMGAALLFVDAFMIVSGIQIMMSRIIDIRKTFIIAFSLMFGISVDLFPSLYSTVHPWLAPIFSSSLTVATVFALLLNLLFRVGVASRVHVELVPERTSSDTIFTFMEGQGGKWAARREVIQRAAAALNEVYEAVQLTCHRPTAVAVDAAFDELNLDLTATYEGVSLAVPSAPPDQDTLLASDRGVLDLSGFFIRRLADRVRVGQENGRCAVRLHFEH